MADFDWQGAMQHPLTLLGAGMMTGSDPMRTGLGGFGSAILNTGQIMRSQEQLAEEQARARQLADIQMQTFRAEQAKIEQARAQREMQAQAQQNLLGQPGLSPMQQAAIQAGYGKQAMGQVFAEPAAAKPYTDEAKIAADVSAGFLSPEMGQKARDRLLQGKSIEPADRFKMEGDLNKRFDKNTQAFKELSNAYTAIQTLPETGIGDIALATKIMKLLDPGSVVRESELGVALGATGLLDRLLNMATKAKEGRFLNEKQRQEFRELAGGVYEAAKVEFDKVRNVYTQRALDYGLKPANVIDDYSSRVNTPPINTPVNVGGSIVTRISD